MNYYPIYIPTLNRYEHLKRCIESLARNTHADKTELVIGLDYPPSDKYFEGYNKIKNYLPTISGFKKVTIIERTENYGPLRNNRALLDYVFSKYDAAIGTEDDNEFSPCFLDYMDRALEYFQHIPKVVSISGFIESRFYGESEKRIMYTHDNNAWGLGLWKGKVERFRSEEFYDIVSDLRTMYKIFRTNPSVCSLLIAMMSQGAYWGDVAWSVMNIVNDTCQLRPTFSLVKNWGYDGSGVHCATEDPDDSANQVISVEKVFPYDLNDVETEYSVSVRHYEFVLPAGVLLKIRYVLAIIVKYYLLRRKMLKNRK